MLEIYFVFGLEHSISRYSMDQMYEVVADVAEYNQFVPWCKESSVFQRRPGNFKCNLTVGFPPIQEKYTSIVTLARPHLVKVCIELFSLSMNTMLIIIFFLIYLDDGKENTISTNEMYMSVLFQ